MRTKHPSAEADVMDALCTAGFACESLVAIGGWRAGRATYRVTLPDGRLLKARRHQGRLRGARAAEYTRALDDPSFPAPLAVIGRVTLETWVEGKPVRGQRLNRELVDAAAALLIRLHAVESLAGRRIRSSAVVRPLAQRIERMAHDLVDAGIVGGREQRRMLDAVRRGLPRIAVRGLTHGDFCAENLVVTADRGLVCIDNEAIGLGFLDEDLARTWCRWPMPPWAWARFRGHAAVDDGAMTASATELAWRTVAAVRGAHRWARARGTVGNAPLEALRRVMTEISST